MAKNVRRDVQVFRHEVEQRQIKHLVHFTPILNLMSIFEHGALLSREQLARISAGEPLKYMDDYLEICDNQRFDGMLNMINVSIERPNHYLLKKFRERSVDNGHGWCVIMISPHVLYQEGIKFSVSNAASGSSRAYGIGGSIGHFRAMFQDVVEVSSSYRKRVFRRTSHSASWPTDIQAEVLVPDRIGVSDISGVYFENEEDLRSIKAGVKVIYSGSLPKFEVNQSIFVGG